MESLTTEQIQTLSGWVDADRFSTGRSSRELHWRLLVRETPRIYASVERGTENVLGRDHEVPRRGHPWR